MQNECKISQNEWKKNLVEFEFSSQISELTYIHLEWESKVIDFFVIHSHNRHIGL